MESDHKLNQAEDVDARIHSSLCSCFENQIAPHQALLLAHLLTLEGSPEDEMSRTLAGARVDMNPH